MRLFFPTVMFTALTLMLGAAGASAAPQHALTVYGEPAKYPEGFSHFAYANPQATSICRFIPRPSGRSNAAVCH